MKKVLFSIILITITVKIHSQDINFQSEYNKILWPINSTHPYGGGITGDDGNYKRLALFHGHSIDLQTGNNSVNKNNSRLYIDSNGKVGIGTRNPDMKLTVKGNIHAEEVKIDLSVPAPDYVFKKNYELRTIEELEKFIKQYSHLPEIPSAKEFEQNGVMQAEMDMNLLKKIEELTLYTIQQQKEIENLKKENQELKSLSDRLVEIEKLLKSKK